MGTHYYVSYSYKVPANTLQKGGDIDMDIVYDYRNIGIEYESEILKNADINKK